MFDSSESGSLSRLARSGELLLTYRFQNMRIGLASAKDVESSPRFAVERRVRTWWFARTQRSGVRGKSNSIPPVHISPGTLLRMSHIPPELRRRLALQNVEDVCFFQHAGDCEFYRDAVRFSNGSEVLLQSLPEGVHFVPFSMTQEEQLIELRTPAWPEALAA